MPFVKDVVLYIELLIYFSITDRQHETETINVKCIINHIDIHGHHNAMINGLPITTKVYTNEESGSS